MPEINPDKDKKTLEDVDAIVLSALKMLGGAGGHKEGFKGLGKSILIKVIKSSQCKPLEKGYRVF